MAGRPRDQPDRTVRNPNLLWHRRLWLIDHGAALYVQHPAAELEHLVATLVD